VHPVHVEVNGERVQLDDPASVATLLQRYQLAERPCAVEVNEMVVPRREHATRVLRDGDRIEIVTLVGGG
jgi:sulfur carrier protein